MRCTYLYPAFSRYMTSSHQLTTREIPSSPNLNSPPVYWRKYILSNMQVTDSWNNFDSKGTPLPLNVSSNLEHLRPKLWFVILSMRKVNGGLSNLPRRVPFIAIRRDRLKLCILHYDRNLKCLCSVTDGSKSIYTSIYFLSSISYLCASSCDYHNGWEHFRAE